MRMNRWGAFIQTHVSRVSRGDCLMSASISVGSDHSQTPPAEALTDRDVRVIYIMGAGRSGSTLLDTILASHPEVVGVGELVNLHSAGWTAKEICACGQL